jgi:transcription initiation factor TFIIE subunit alpha
MQVNLLKNVVSSVAGQSASPIVDLLFNKKNVNEFLIAKKLKLTINQTRNILYKLADEGIVSFTRKKDRTKGGWYTYFWTLNSGKGLMRFREHLTDEIEKLKNQLTSKKTERFFYCANCQLESNEESALLHQYTCPECGEVLQLKEKGKEIETIEREVARLVNILNNVNQEIGVITKKEEAVKTRKMRAEERKKAKERALKRKRKEREMKKLKRKKTKKKKINRKAARKAGARKKLKLRKKLKRMLGI